MSKLKLIFAKYDINEKYETSNNWLHNYSSQSVGSNSSCISIDNIIARIWITKINCGNTAISKKFTFLRLDEAFLFCGCIDINAFHKIAKVTLFPHLTSHVISHWMLLLPEKTKKTTGSRRRRMTACFWITYHVNKLICVWFW